VSSFFASKTPTTQPPIHPSHWKPNPEKAPQLVTQESPPKKEKTTTTTTTGSGNTHPTTEPNNNSSSK
jgi:hypothetical protein